MSSFWQTDDLEKEANNGILFLYHNSMAEL